MRMIVALCRPVASEDEVELRQIAGYLLIGYARTIPFGCLMASAFDRAGAQYQPSVEIMRAESACTLVREGAGIALVDEFSVSGHGWSGVVVKPLRENIPLTLSMLRSRFDKQSSHARELARMIRQHAHTQGRGIDTRA
jgi:DNA-binding transcriptional LysR family regulator